MKPNSSRSVSGSVVTAVYTGRMASAQFGADVPDAARDNLAAALTASQELPPEAATGLVAAGREAFAAAVNYGALVSAGLLVAAAIIAAFGLRRVAPIGQSESE
jgi:MFS transporter, DHA2 family, multidrug resistance protein